MATKFEELVEEIKSDFEFFCENFLKIQTKDGRLVPFVFNRAQRHLWRAVLRPQMQAGLPIRWLLLKGRQMGMSTFIAAFIFWIVITRPNRNAAVASHEDDSAKELFRKQQLFLRELPVELRPMTKINNRGHLYFTNPDMEGEGGLESQIIVDVASNVNMGRSFTLHLLHWSEFAMLPHALETLGAVTASMPRNPGTAIIIETTAKGPGPFQDLWDAENFWHKVFLCWVAAEEYRVEVQPEDYIELHDHDHEVFGNEEIEAGRVEAELQDWYPDESKDTRWLAHELQCRMVWRRRTIVDECGSDLAIFNREYPTTPDDAFLGTSKSVFNTYKLSDMRARVREAKIEHKTFRFDFASNTFYEARYGPLTMYEPFYPGSTYVIGADTARGVKGGDPSAAVLLRCPALVTSGVFCDVIPPDDFAVLLYYWGKQHAFPLIGVEANEEGGFSVNKILAGRMDVEGEKYRYPKLYRRDISEKLTADPTDIHGWQTSSISKDWMITDLNMAIDSDLIQILHIPTINELLKYQEITTRTGRKSTGVPRSAGHDDQAMALMIAYQMATRAYHQAAEKPKRGKAPKWSMEWWAKLTDNAPARL